MAKFAGRKVVVTTVVIGTAVGLDVLTGLSNNMTALLQTTIAAFVAGNVGEHGFDALKKRGARTVSLAPFAEAMNSLSDKVGELTEKDPQMELPINLETNIQTQSDSLVLLNKAVSKIDDKLTRIATAANIPVY